MQELKPHICPHEGCGKAFNRPFKLNQHLDLHNNIKKFICTYAGCTKTYSSKSHLDRHIKSTHDKEKDKVLFGCPTCMLKCFTNRQNLKRHIKICHNTRRDIFTCDICKENFKKKHQLSSHMFDHNGVMAFSCENCPKSFVTLFEKKRHMRFHREYKCDTCAQVFNQWSKYQKHRKTEHISKEYICDNCSRSFKQRQHILRHMKIHNRDVEVFVCQYGDCKRQYLSSNNLKQHIRYKHKKVTHDCNVCNQKLSTKSKLVYHMKLHEKEPVIRNYKTLADGRKARKDKGSIRTITALKITGLTKEMVEECNPCQSLMVDDVKVTPSTSVI